MRFLLSDIIKSAAATPYGNLVDTEAVTDIIFDSRSLVEPSGTLFCALRTRSADGHRFIRDLYKKGVRMFMVDSLPSDFDSMDDAIFMKVADVASALERIAADWRGLFKGKVIGITGSAGKTVVKEMIYCALSAGTDAAVSASPRSWNSRLGVPMSLLEASADDDVVIVEAGIDSPGDMDRHAAIIRPDIGILTSITDEHSSGFASRREKIYEKIRLFKDTPVIIYDGSDSMTEEVIRETYPEKTLVPVTGPTPIATDRLLAARALEMAGYPAKVDGENLTNRIDVHEGVNDCVMLYDDFTNTLRSLRWALDFMRRRMTGDRSATLITSDLFHGSLDETSLTELYTRFGRMLEAFGISRVIAIGPEIKRFLQCIPKGIAVEPVDSVSEFLSVYDINRFSSEMILIAGAPRGGFRQIKNMLETPRHDTIFEIDLDAIVHNFNRFRSALSPETGIVAMIKASAYGTGALEVAKTLQSQGAGYLAVAVVDEGVELRRGGITMPVMVLNPVTTNYKALFKYNLEPSVFSLRELETLVAEARKSGVESFNAHIKLDTGMHRVGFTESELPGLISMLKNSPEVRVKSIFSHLATADDPAQTDYTDLQLRTFKKLSDDIIAAVGYPVMRHILNTAGIITRPDHQYDMVRLGIGLYGVSPLENETLGLNPVASLKTTIISLKEWEPGTTIGYGRRGHLARRSIIATLPIGYADGLDRHLSRGAAAFLVRGVECPTVGNICMDQCMIDVTDVPGVSIGDEVEIFGRNIPVQRLARTLDTIPYEILTSVSPRVRRIYFRD